MRLEGYQDLMTQSISSAWGHSACGLTGGAEPRVKAVLWLPPAAYQSCSWPIIHAIPVEPGEANSLPSTLAAAAWSHGRGPQKCVSA